MSAKWRNIIREKLAPIYNGIRRHGQISDICIPADNGDFNFFQQEMYLFFKHEYLDTPIDGKDYYISCYYVVEMEEFGEEDRYIEVGQNLEEVLAYLVRNFSVRRLLNMHVGCIDDVLSYTHG